MLSFTISDVFKHVNHSTCNTLQLNYDVGLSIGEVNIKIGECEKTICVIIDKGDYLNFSWNIVNRIFDNLIVTEFSITVDFNNLKPIKDVQPIKELIIQPIVNLYEDNYDFSHSIYDYFTTDCYLCLNDCIKVPINYYDYSLLLPRNFSNHLVDNHFFVNVTSISVENDANNCGIFYFNHSISKMCLKNDAICKRVFDFDVDLDRYYDSLRILLSMLLSTVRSCECMPLLTTMSGYPLVHIYGPPQSGKGTLIKHAAHILGHRCIVVNGNELHGQAVSAMEKKFETVLSLVHRGIDFLSIHFRDFDDFFVDSDQNNERTVRVFTKFLATLLALGKRELVLFVSTVAALLPAPIDLCVFVRYDAARVSADDRSAIIRGRIGDEHEAVEDLVKMSLRLPRMELVNIMGCLTIKGQSSKEIIEQYKCLAVSGHDQQAIESVTWRDIGALGEIIHEVLATIKLILSEHKPVDGYHVRKSGILLYGDPGTGKTLLAKALASECNLNFVSVKGPELLNMYVGQTEENVRTLFAKVKQSVPCLLFCDELDSIVPRRGFSGDSGGVMDRVVSQFALEMDAINNEENMRVVVIGATNRPDLIDAALLRNGRFDNLFHVVGGLDKAQQLDILRSQTYKLNLEEDVDLNRIVELFPDGVMTGARIYGIVSTAIMNAIRRTIGMVEANDVDDDCSLTVSMNDFLSAL